MQYNMFAVLGRLTKDPRQIPTKTGTMGYGFTVASTHKSRNKAGEVKEETLFIDCNAWGKTAEGAQVLKKGMEVFVSGRLRTETFQDKTTQQERSVIKLLADTLLFNEKLSGVVLDEEEEDVFATKPKQQQFKKPSTPFDDFE